MVVPVAVHGLPACMVVPVAVLACPLADCQVLAQDVPHALLPEPPPRTAGDPSPGRHGLRVLPAGLWLGGSRTGAAAARRIAHQHSSGTLSKRQARN